MEYRLRKNNVVKTASNDTDKERLIKEGFREIKPEEGKMEGAKEKNKKG